MWDFFRALFINVHERIVIMDNMSFTIEEIENFQICWNVGNRDVYKNFVLVTCRFDYSFDETVINLQNIE